MAAHHFNIRRLHWHKHQYEVRALHAGQVCVVFRGEGINVVANRLCMRLECGGSLSIILSGDRTLVVHQRDLAVDDEILPFG